MVGVKHRMASFAAASPLGAAVSRVGAALSDGKGVLVDEKQPLMKFACDALNNSNASFAGLYAGAIGTFKMSVS